MSGAQHLENFLQFLVAGLLTGVVYGLMCVGLSVIFGIMRVINLAQGEFMMVGMYVAYYLVGLIGAQVVLGDFATPYVAALAAGGIVIVFGMLVHWLLVSRVSGVGGIALEREGHSAQLVLTLGLSLILANGGLVLFGSAPVSIATPLASTPWVIGPLYGEEVSIFVNQGQTVAAVAAAGVVAAFALIMAGTRLGRSLRAAADNPTAALYVGIDVERAYRIAFGFGVGITAIGGGLLASSHPVRPDVGSDFVIVMCAGVVLGGLGSLGGAFFGGLTIGLVQQLGALFLPNQLQNPALFVCFLLIVLLKPEGLFGRAARRA